MNFGPISSVLLPSFVYWSLPQALHVSVPIFMYGVPHMYCLMQKCNCVLCKLLYTTQKTWKRCPICTVHNAIRNICVFISRILSSFFAIRLQVVASKITYILEWQMQNDYNNMKLDLSFEANQIDFQCLGVTFFPIITKRRTFLIHAITEPNVTIVICLVDWIPF